MKKKKQSKRHQRRSKRCLKSKQRHDALQPQSQTSSQSPSSSPLPLAVQRERRKIRDTNRRRTEIARRKRQAHRAPETTGSRSSAQPPFYSKDDWTSVVHLSVLFLMFSSVFVGVLLIREAGRPGAFKEEVASVVRDPDVIHQADAAHRVAAFVRDPAAKILPPDLGSGRISIDVRQSRIVLQRTAARAQDVLRPSDRNALASVATRPNDTLEARDNKRGLDVETTARPSFATPIRKLLRALPNVIPGQVDPSARQALAVREPLLRQSLLAPTPHASLERSPIQKSRRRESFGLALASAAERQLNDFVFYNEKYLSISYPGGDVPDFFGVCTDVIIRAYRTLGIDLQALVHRSRVGSGDRNIDHRRTQTLRKFFARSGQSLKITSYADEYLPGDIVTYYRPQNRGSKFHIAMVSKRLGASGRPMILHNRGWGPQLEDALFVDEITGHYRFQPEPVPPSAVALGMNKRRKSALGLLSGEK